MSMEPGTSSVITHRIISAAHIDKTYHVIQNRTIVIRRYPPYDLISVVWFYFKEGKPTKKRTLKLNFKLVKENQKGLFAKASDG